MSFEGIDIKGLAEENRSGGLELYLLPVSSIAEFPTRAGTAYLNDVIPNSGDNFVKIRFTQFTSNLDIRKRIKDQTEVWDHRVRGEVPKQRFEVLQRLFGYNNERFIAIYVNINGDQRLIGTPEDPLFINWDEDCGRKPGDFNSYVLDFNWVADFPAPFYQSALSFKECKPVDIFVDGVFRLSAEPGSTVNIEVNSAFNLQYEYQDEAKAHTLIYFRPHVFTQGGTIDGISSQSASLTNIEYSFDDVTYQSFSFPTSFNTNDTLYLRAEKDPASDYGFLNLFGTYS